VRWTGKHMARANPCSLRSDNARTVYKRKKRLYFLDYDVCACVISISINFFMPFLGTLTPIVKTPSMATPSEETLSALTQLTADPETMVYIISGRDGAFLETQLGHIEGLGMSAEHGGFMRKPHQRDWTNFTGELGHELDERGSGGV